MSQLLENQRLTFEQRKASMDFLRLAMKNSYIGWSLKATLIGKSGDDILDECQSVQKLKDQPILSFEFYDDLRACIAKFEDAHLNITRLLPPPFVITGIANTAWINSKLIITRNRPELIRKFQEVENFKNEELVNALSIGNEILEIDDQVPSDQIKDLSKFISSSTDDSRMAFSANLFFSRNFNFPRQSMLKLKIRNQQNEDVIVQIPWVQTINNQGGIDSELILESKGIKKTLTFAEKEFPLIKSEGFEGSDQLIDDLKEYKSYVLSQENEPVIRLGLQKITNEDYRCYLQILDFDIKNTDKKIPYKIFLENTDPKKEMTSVGMIQEVKKFLLSCEENSSELILDLRDNGGGSTHLMTAIYAMFEDPEKNNLFVANAYPKTPGNLAFMLASLKSLTGSESTVKDETFFQIYNQIGMNPNVTNWIVISDKKLTRKVYTKRLLVLTSPFCISACENLVHRLKATRRAQIIGQATNGTGFGFSSNSAAETKFRDPFNLYELRMPNHAFSFLLNPDATNLSQDQSFLVQTEKFENIPLLENNPAIPDFDYKINENDLFGFKSYLEFIDSVSETSN
ncbi:MAG: S41 family peptidase [Pseudobdellovibrionaceae bacterium]